jgi:hypothetical protein
MKLGRTEFLSVVLAVLAVVSVLVVLGTRSTPTTTERDFRAKNLIPIWREDEVRRLELKAGDTTTIVERAPDGWLVRTPEPEPADDATVSKLLNALAFATPARRLDPADSRAHGLEQPRAQLLVEMGDQKLTLSLGEDAPSPAGAVYVALDGTPGGRIGAVASPAVKELFATRPDDLRRRALVTLGSREVAELQIERPNGKIRLTRGQALAFRLDGAERANRDACEPLFTALARLSATRFLTPAAAEKAREGAAITQVTLIPRDGKTGKTQVELGGSCPGSDDAIAIVRSPRLRAACVQKDTLQALSVEREALGDRYPFSARKDEVEALALEQNGKKLVLERRGTAFLLREPSEAQVELEAGNRRVEAIVRAPASRVERVDAKALGFEPPTGRLTVRAIGDDDKAVEEKLELGKTAPDGTLYVRRVEDGTVLAIEREAARAFAVDSTLLRSQKVLEFALSALNELELSAPERQRVKRVPTGFELVEPSGFEHDGELTTDAVLALGSLTALRWVADADDGSFGLERPTFTARARFDTADAGSSERVLVVGRPAPGGYFATLEGTPGVFVMERASALRLSTLLVNRSEFMADPSTLGRVTLGAAGREIVLERRAGALVEKTGAVPEATVHRALEALASLRAEAAVHTGAAQPSEGFATPRLTVKLEPMPGLGSPRGFRLGGTDSYRGDPVRLARADGVNATFAIAEAKLAALFDLF